MAPLEHGSDAMRVCDAFAGLALPPSLWRRPSACAVMEAGESARSSPPSLGFQDGTAMSARMGCFSGAKRRYRAISDINCSSELKPRDEPDPRALRPKFSRVPSVEPMRSCRYDAHSAPARSRSGNRLIASAWSKALRKDDDMAVLGPRVPACQCTSERSRSYSYQVTE